MHAMIGEDVATDHPANRFSRGEITEFYTATVVYEQAIKHELGLGYTSLEDGKWWERELTSCLYARLIWKLTDEESDAVTIAHLRSADLDIWADALQSGSYVELAF